MGNEGQLCYLIIIHVVLPTTNRHESNRPVYTLHRSRPWAYSIHILYNITDEIMYQFLGTVGAQTAKVMGCWSEEPRRCCWVVAVGSLGKTLYPYTHPSLGMHKWVGCNRNGVWCKTCASLNVPFKWRANYAFFFLIWFRAVWDVTQFDLTPCSTYCTFLPAIFISLYLLSYTYTTHKPSH